MDRIAGQLQAFFKATLLALLGLVLFSVVTMATHACSCLRTFLFVSIPSAASAVATPKCLFVFSNIIVVFLATESKLSRSCEDIDVVCHQQLAALAPVMKENDAEKIVEEEDSMVVAVQQSLHQADRREQKDASSSSIIFVVEELRELEEESDDGHMELVEEQGRVAADQDEVIEREECDEEEEEEMGLRTYELNKKVEDFIARFNLERQLEARMLVCCC